MNIKMALGLNPFVSFKDGVLAFRGWIARTDIVGYCDEKFAPEAFDGLNRDDRAWPKLRHAHKAGRVLGKIDWIVHVEHTGFLAHMHTLYREDNPLVVALAEGSDGLSVGFHASSREVSDDETVIRKSRLVEVSVVNFPMHTKCRLIPADQWSDYPTPEDHHRITRCFHAPDTHKTLNG